MVRTMISSRHRANVRQGGQGNLLPEVTSESSMKYEDCGEKELQSSFGEFWISLKIMHTRGDIAVRSEGGHAKKLYLSLKKHHDC